MRVSFIGAEGTIVTPHYVAMPTPLARAMVQAVRPMRADVAAVLALLAVPHLDLLEHVRAVLIAAVYGCGSAKNQS